jgi:hypothetical protein
MYARHMSIRCRVRDSTSPPGHQQQHERAAEQSRAGRQRNRRDAIRQPAETIVEVRITATPQPMFAREPVHRRGEPRRSGRSGVRPSAVPDCVVVIAAQRRLTEPRRCLGCAGVEAEQAVCGASLDRIVSDWAEVRFHRNRFQGRRASVCRNDHKSSCSEPTQRSSHVIPPVTKRDTNVRSQCVSSMSEKREPPSGGSSVREHRRFAIPRGVGAEGESIHTGIDPRNLCSRAPCPRACQAPSAASALPSNQMPAGIGIGDA